MEAVGAGVFFSERRRQIFLSEICFSASAPLRMRSGEQKIARYALHPPCRVGYESLK